MYVEITSELKEQALRIAVQSFIGDGLRKVSPNQLAGPCPFCGGDDRFNILTDTNKWFCRKNVCGGSPSHKPGSVIDFVGKMYNLNFVEAVKFLVGDTSEVKKDLPKINLKSVKSIGKVETVQDKAAWQSMAKKFLSRSISVAGQEDFAYDYLKGRGVSWHIAKQYNVGHCPKEFAMDCLQWGIPHTKEINVIRFSEGLVIPVITKGIITHLNIRASNPHLTSKYKAVKGSSKAIPFNFDELLNNRLPVLLLESEIDSMIIKSIPDLDGVVVPISTLSITGCRNKRVTDTLNKHTLLLNSYDNESNNKDVESACKYWEVNTSIAYKRLIPLKKDVGEMYNQGHDIAKWVINAIEKSKPNTKQFAMNIFN